MSAIQNPVAVRTFKKILDIKLAPLNEGFEMDSLFDHGEYSHAAYQPLFENAENEVLELVAGKFGLSTAHLWNEYQRYMSADYDIPALMEYKARMWN